MKNTSLLLFLMICMGGCANSQQNNSETLKDIDASLRQKTATVSSILSSEKYHTLHPETDFRNMIKKYSNTEPLSMVVPSEPGLKIRITGVITGKNGNALKDCEIYVYQTDYRGWYAANSPHVGGGEGDMRHARIFGYVKTDDNGRFEIHTIKPSGYPNSQFPAHIHFHLSAPGQREYVSELLFDDDERLKGDIREEAVRSRYHIAKPEKAETPFDQQFSYAITLSR